MTLQAAEKSLVMHSLTLTDVRSVVESGVIVALVVNDGRSGVVAVAVDDEVEN